MQKLYKHGGEKANLNNKKILVYQYLMNHFMEIAGISYVSL